MAREFDMQNLCFEDFMDVIFGACKKFTNTSRNITNTNFCKFIAFNTQSHSVLLCFFGLDHSGLNEVFKNLLLFK